MPYVLVRHKVEDYTTWKPMFDEGEMGRRALGSKGGYVFRNADDANEVFILMEVTDLEQARQAAQSERCASPCSGRAWRINQISTSWRR